MAFQLNDKSYLKPLRGHVSPIARWIIGRDAFSEQEYLFHTEYPVFFAKVGRDDETGILSGLSFAMRGQGSLYDFFWFDPFPENAAFLELMREAEDALDEFAES